MFEVFEKKIVLKRLLFINVIIVQAFMFIACENNQKNHERLLPLEGAYNVRDMGGYKTKEGKIVKWGKIFRSGDLDKLTDADLEYLNEIPIRTYVDFRDSLEIANAPDKKPTSLLHTFKLPINAGNMIDLHNVSIARSDTLMEDINRLLVNQSQATYKDFFRILADKSNIPLLFHCSAGKDRTGIAAALFLSALGVEREIIIQDYLLSADYLKDKYALEIKQYPQLAPLMTVKRSYIETAFDEIDKKYGGVENYLIRFLDVDLDQMKSIYTE